MTGLLIRHPTTVSFIISSAVILRSVYGGTTRYPLLAKGCSLLASCYTSRSVSWIQQSGCCFETMITASMLTNARLICLWCEGCDDDVSVVEMLAFHLLQCVCVCVWRLFLLDFGYTYNVACVEPDEPFYVVEAFLRSQFSCIVKYFHYR